MQNMFSTMNISSQPIKTEAKQPVSSLDLLNSLSGNTETGQMDFNTMQKMFATNSQNSGLNQGINISPNPNVSLGINQGLNLGSDFNTMQNLFSTGIQNPGQMPYGNTTNLYPMTNLYSTGIQNQGITLNQQVPISTNAQVSPQVPPVNSYNTMENLFGTNTQIKPPQPQAFGTASQPGLNL